MKKNLLITDYRGFLRRKEKKDESLDIQKIIKILYDGGVEFEVVSYENIANNFKYYSQIENSFIIYSASKNEEYNKFIDHTIYLLSKKNFLIPRYELFKAFDDKGFQELYKDYLGIESLNYQYLSHKFGLEKYKDSLKFPLVVKEMVSASSKGVYKSNNYKDAFKIIKKITNNTKDKKLSNSNFSKFLKKIKTKNEIDYNGVGRYVLQEFVPNLKEDWKVLIFGDKYYVLNRKVRKNDFRASGSGEFLYLEPPEEVLHKAREVFEKFKIPFISIDLAYDGSEVHIIELQALNFGPITLINSPFHFVYQNEKWSKIMGKSNLDQEFGNAYLWFINQIKKDLNLD